MTRAFVFPGQGSQAVGMGKEMSEAFVEARHVLQEVDDALEQNLSKLMFEGPEDELILTENAQPALMAVSLAALRVLEKEGNIDLASTVMFVAGHSLGEYSALAAAGTFSIADTARLLKTRGRAMQQAVPVGEGAMAALLGLDLEAASSVADEAKHKGVCMCANDNADGQIVISGEVAAIEYACEIAKERGAKRAVLLPVSAPFHCSMMAPAAEAMSEALAAVKMNDPVVPLVANVIACATSEADHIRTMLVEQVTHMVRWRESVLWMQGEGIETLVEIGSGKVLSGLTRRIAKDMTSLNVATPADIEAVLAAIT
ncbi:MAG: ACP S-malonyltransferase [Rhodospirillales bacterium]|jgi:[acyl-carrier-protein] S-malonyltransferase|nr:ACP S-malonyltransferase [Rhodospirillales bacterium]